MFKVILTISASVILLSCSNKPEVKVSWGTKPKCESENWMTFDFDEVKYFHDTTTGFHKVIYSDSLMERYSISHAGIKLNNKQIENLNAIMSCKLWCNDFSELNEAMFAPQDLIAFMEDGKLVAYLYVNFPSGKVFSKPTAVANEICALRVLFTKLREH